jgi:hypothetical protein
MRRRALLWLAGLALVVSALLLTDRLLWHPGLTEANVRRLRPGMTLAEVEALLGGPAKETIDWQAEGGPSPARRARRHRLWQAPRAARVSLGGARDARWPARLGGANAGATTPFLAPRPERLAALCAAVPYGPAWRWPGRSSGSRSRQ